MYSHCVWYFLFSQLVFPLASFLCCESRAVWDECLQSTEDEATKPLVILLSGQLCDSSWKNWLWSDGPGVSLVPADRTWNCLSCKNCCGWNFWVTSCWFYALLYSTNVKKFVEFYAYFYFVQILILLLVWGWCDVMVIDQAKVNRLCILMLHRLHASKVSEGCVSGFVPCTSPCLKPSLPHPFLIYRFTLKGGGKWGPGGETPQYFK